LLSRDELEQLSVRQRAERHQAMSGEWPEMPVAAVESNDLYVGHEHRFLVDRLPQKLQAERFSYHAVAAVASDQEVDFYYFTSRKCSFHSVLILCESHESFAELDLTAERAQTLTQDCFRVCLWQHPEIRIRHALGRLFEWSE